MRCSDSWMKVYTYLYLSVCACTHVCVCACVRVCVDQCFPISSCILLWKVYFATFPNTVEKAIKNDYCYYYSSRRNSYFALVPVYTQYTNSQKSTYYCNKGENDGRACYFRVIYMPQYTFGKLK